MVDREAGPTAVAGWATALKDVAAIGAILKLAHVTTQHVDTLQMVVAREICGADDDLAISIAVSGVCGHGHCDVWGLTNQANRRRADGAKRRRRGVRVEREVRRHCGSV